MEANDMFDKLGYCLIKSAVSKEIVDLVSQYALFDESQNFSPDNQQVYGAHAKYADPIMESLLLHLHPIIEKNTGLKLYPTYSYYRVYRNNDELIKHTDRPSCEISATLCFNYNYDDTKFRWPIYMNGFEANLEPGDLVIYKGCDIEHWREKLINLNPVWHVQGFFHYVDANGRNSEWKFDKRPSIGFYNKRSRLQSLEKDYIIYIK